MAEPIQSESSNSPSDENSVLVFVGIVTEDNESPHTGEKVFRCSRCWKCFTRKSSLVRHQVDHTGEKSYTCTKCGARFSRQNYLAKHMKRHGVKPRHCGKCGKKLKSGTNCNCRLQNVEKMFPCSKCCKCFTHKSSLVRHQVDHTGEKPYTCPECGKCFSRQNYLTKHIKLHSVKPQRCVECGNQLKSGSSCHCRVKSGASPSFCTDCGEKLEGLRCTSDQCQKEHTKMDDCNTNLDPSESLSRKLVKQEVSSHDITFKIEPEEFDDSGYL